MQQYLSVTKDIEGESGIVSLDGKDIIFLEWSGRLARLLVHTLDHTYYTMGTMKYWTTVLNNSDYRFEIVDRNNAVNVDRIKRLDPILCKAYFEDNLNKNSKYCTMAINRYRKLEREIVTSNPSIIVT
ncbi:LytTR family transcriptional regulator DNA-binding domain-containing protein [Paenibacillus crassostreae]|uniref:HTH LytTR-type domain-containing protein n=1 Tax=Paenibacillus crassostreae TaxID=1763538 RepID=A0A167DMH6_9BACL|nr:LytTR family transcriptional regulator DNA-binding domain-containing protein [Paenibacillus crassostreae]AOZ91281.1 hypothetical protein LPB68_03070 [Paenibacillus crassostreae]OAB74560.1 hypothetical protein PNBC_10890 [Paenibacillus crassostreae]